MCTRLAVMTRMLNTVGPAIVLVFAAFCIGATDASAQRPDPEAFAQAFAQQSNHAGWMSLAVCQGDDWAEQLIVELRRLPLSDDLIGRLSLDWGSGPSECVREHTWPWFLRAAAVVAEPGAAAILAKSMARLAGPQDLEAVAAFGRDPLRDPAIRRAFQREVFYVLDGVARLEFFTDLLEVGVLDVGLRRRAIPFLVPGPDRDLFARMATRAALRSPDGVNVVGVLRPILWEANVCQTEPSGLSLETRDWLRAELLREDALSQLSEADRDAVLQLVHPIPVGPDGKATLC